VWYYLHHSRHINDGELLLKEKGTDREMARLDLCPSLACRAVRPVYRSVKLQQYVLGQISILCLLLGPIVEDIGGAIPAP
jgi:hypothetical protein